jgi:hypothetical protein
MRSAAHLDDAHCADLVLGLSPADERAEALAHAAECPACEARLRAHASAAERARSGVPGAGRVLRPAGGWRPSRALVLPAVAALLVAAVAAPLLMRRGAPSERMQWLSAPGEAVHTRAGEAADPQLAAGLAAYEARDLATAERELSAAHVRGAEESLRRLYLAQVELARGDADAALALLRGIPWRQVPEPWRGEGAALLARTLRRTGDTPAADSIEHALRTHDPATPFIP